MSFKEKYKTWSKMVVQAYDMSGKTMKPRKNCSKVQKRYKELRKIQRRERKERIANNHLNAEI